MTWIQLQMHRFSPGWVNRFSFSGLTIQLPWYDITVSPKNNSALRQDKPANGYPASMLSVREHNGGWQHPMVSRI